MNKGHNITQVVSKSLCNTCGACYGICPVNAICYQETTGGCFFPEVDEMLCTKCGLCLNVCPGIHFGKTLISTMPEDPFSGCALEAFIGKAADKQLFANSQSGGIVSALLLHALESKRINGAVTVVMQMGTPPRPAVIIANSFQDILQAQKSKYCPVPTLGFIKDIENHDGPLAVVGTSCQIHGLKNLLDHKKKLKNKIAFTIGLVCDRVLTYSALDYLISKSSKMNDNKPKILHFRDKSVSGYPGDVHIFSNDGDSIVISAKNRMQIKNYFTPARCRLCFDKMNVFSDITVGDPHGLKSVDRKFGESMLVARTKLGQAIIRESQNDRAIIIRPTQYEQILIGQNINQKKQQWYEYSKNWKNIGEELPDYFELVHKKSYLNATTNQKQIERDLKQALLINKLKSREEVFKFVDSLILRKKINNKMLFPVRAFKKILKSKHP